MLLDDSIWLPRLVSLRDAMILGSNLLSLLNSDSPVALRFTCVPFRLSKMYRWDCLTGRPVMLKLDLKLTGPLATR